MKKILRFLLRHFISIPVFVFFVILSIQTLNWAGVILGIVFGSIIYFLEYIFRMHFYKPSKEDMQKYRKEQAIVAQNDKSKDDFWMIGY